MTTAQKSLQQSPGVASEASTLASAKEERQGSQASGTPEPPYGSVVRKEHGGAATWKRVTAPRLHSLLPAVCLPWQPLAGACAAVDTGAMPLAFHTRPALHPVPAWPEPARTPLCPCILHLLMLLTSSVSAAQATSLPVPTAWPVYWQCRGCPGYQDAQSRAQLQASARSPAEDPRVPGTLLGWFEGTGEAL